MLEGLFAALFVFILVGIVSRRAHLRLRVRLELFVLLLAVLVAGSYVIAKRFQGGLGAVTHLSDRFPWGIWIAFDLCGIALAAGGFVLAATVHIFHMRRYEPILRAAVLTSFIAYSLVAAILILDLGRPYRFWHPLIMWQPHSVMFEITLCLTCYSLVLMLEFSPVIFHRFGWDAALEMLERVTLPVVMLGVILSTLHQSSFGSLFLIVPHKLSALWYTPMLPLLFLLSAVSAGMAMVIVEARLCQRFLQAQLSPELFMGLGKGLSRVLMLYGAVKLGDLLWRAPWMLVRQTPWLGGLLLVEILFGIVVPIIWLMRLARQRRQAGVVPAALCAIGGIVLNRLDVCWFGLIPAMGAQYVPSWMELASTAALVLAGILAFLAVAELTPVFPSPSRAPDHH
jgi:Ni/Fe-hydrogenase subunit HybB-like protein